MTTGSKLFVLSFSADESDVRSYAAAANYGLAKLRLDYRKQ